jgi:anti-anti-sigma factor
MEVKIDTREKFHVITILSKELTANMTAEMENCLLPYQQNDVNNLVLKFNNVINIDVVASETLVKIQQSFYEHHASFVICEIQPVVEDKLEEMNLLELMNTTLTESEAWDIVQMEEIERELMGGEEDI